MKQVICECGRIAEVRRRSNGKKLRYKVCKCGTSLGGIESAALLEREERDDIGAVGEFFKKSEPVVESSISDWVPDESCDPLVIESDHKDMPAVESDAKKGGFGKVLGFGCLLVGTATGVFLGYDAFKQSKGLAK